MSEDEVGSIRRDEPRQWERPGNGAARPVKPPPDQVPEAWGRRGTGRERDDRPESTGHEGVERREDAKDEGTRGEEDRGRGWSTTKKVVVGVIIASVLLLAAVGGLVWWLYARQFEKTDDAFIDAHTERVAPQVAGRVSRVLVTDNQEVKAGDVLVEIDPADYQAQVEQARAARAEAQGRQSQAEAQKLVAEANVDQARADLDQADVNLQNAQVQLKRYEGLSREAVTPQRLDDLRAAARNADAQRHAMAKKLVAAQAQVQLATSQIEAGRAGVRAAQAKFEQANLNLSYTSVRAATAGRVTNRQVQAGDYLTAGQQLMVLVPHEVWVTANYKENQLAHMRPGQPVDIDVDAYPDVDFHGHVDSIQKGSGAWFSLLPPENATGNYVKVVQRVPVKIVFDETGSDAYRRLAPGMSVVPKVRVR